MNGSLKVETFKIGAEAFYRRLKEMEKDNG